MEGVNCCHFSREVSDPEELVEAIRGSRIDACLLAKGNGVSRLERMHLPRTCLDTARIASPLLATGEMPADCYTLIYVTECPREGHSFNFSIRHGSGYIGFFAPGGVIDAFVPPGYANATLTIPQNLFLREIHTRFPELPHDWMRLGAPLMPPETSRSRLDALMAARNESERTDPGWLADTGKHFEEEVLEVFIEALRESHLQGVVESSTVNIRRYRTMRRIRAHLAENRGVPLRMEDLCGASGMSRRGLDYLFQDFFGVGTNTFIRCQRLHGARREILIANPEPGYVKRIALNWGFWHLGRFAADYRRMFGENPRDTLHRRWRHSPASIGGL